GASSGFGEAMAHVFAAAGWSLILTARRAQKLTDLAAALTAKGASVLPLVFDVKDKEKVFSTLQNLPTDWQAIDVLVNNAGLALGRDSFENADLAWETMIDTNVKGLIYVTKALLPGFVARQSGHIINIGSTAGKEVYKDGNAYCASKHAVDALSKAMRIDLLPHRIKVSVIHPGAADTEFSTVRFKGDTQKASQVYAGYEPLAAQDVAEIALYLAQLPAHVCINDLTVTCLAQANSFYLHK
ncbi:MAG: SDR family NAD(P)-dependent oxidoreductase, partial [Sphingobacteriia bacterium]